MMRIECSGSLCDVIGTRDCSDRCLNVAGYIPFVSTFTGALRVLSGAVEMLASMFFFFIEIERAEVHLKSVLHGIDSIFRGSIEMIPVIGNVIMIAYDCMDFLDC